MAFSFGASSTGFGQPAAPATSAFGQPAANPAQNTGFSFGAQNQNQAANPAASNTGFSFGQTNTNTANQQPAGSNLFGQQNTTNTFGQQSNTGGFGQQATTGFGQPAANTFGQKPLFGNQTQQPTQSLFGNNQQQSNAFGTNQQQPTQSLFGNNQQQQPNQSLFGNNQQQQQNKSLFGNNTQPTTSLFGQQPTQSLFGNNQQQQQFQPQVQQQPQVTDLVSYAAACWDPSHPACKFKYYFYNMVHPSEVHLYQPNPNEDRALYEQAQTNNPDPSCMVPVLAVGFEGLKVRLDSQEEQYKTHKEKLQIHTVETVVKIETYRRKQRQIVQKILTLMKNVQLLRNRGYSLRTEEEGLLSALKTMEQDLSKPSVFRGRLNEIWATVQQLKDADKLGNLNGDDWYVLNDPESLKTTTQGLKELTLVTKEDQETLTSIERGYQESAFRKF
ncbi:hypothetical protein HDV02_006159 [Globomyces sp. JEL0801]|nr:hypothetical protein HDV02_006159 [Globomyces sp. JEL0801]